MRRGLLHFLLIAGLGTLGCAARDGAVPARNVMLVVIDTLRADHLGCYGYERPTSPNIDAFARGASRYTRAIAPAPWTLPSHASLFTGLDPWEHGAHSFYTRKNGDNSTPLAQDRLTLAEALRDRGFATAGFAANSGFLSRRLHLDQGFETYVVDRKPAWALNLEILPWLESHRAEHFFLFVNYMDAHRPYATEPIPGFLDPPASRDPHLLDALYDAAMPGTQPAPPDLVRRVVDQYDTGVAHADQAVGTLLERLRALVLWRDTLVIVTSDHGEYFGEHQLAGHAKDVYQEALRIPLLVKRAGQERGETLEDPISLTQVPNLIASALPPEDARALEPLFPDAPGQRALLSENYYSRAKDLLHPVWGERFQRVRRALIDWPWKYIQSSDGRNELYDLSADPGEAHNLVDEKPEVAARMAGVVAERTKRAPPETEMAPAEPSEEERKELRALGYID